MKAKSRRSGVAWFASRNVCEFGGSQFPLICMHTPVLQKVLSLLILGFQYILGYRQSHKYGMRIGHTFFKMRSQGAQRCGLRPVLGGDMPEVLHS